MSTCCSAPVTSGHPPDHPRGKKKTEQNEIRFPRGVSERLDTIEAVGVAKRRKQWRQLWRASTSQTCSELRASADLHFALVTDPHDSGLRHSKSWALCHPCVPATHTSPPPPRRSARFISTPRLAGSLSLTSTGVSSTRGCHLERTSATAACTACASRFSNMEKKKAHMPGVLLLCAIFLASLPRAEAGAEALFPYGQNEGDSSAQFGGSQNVPNVPSFHFYGQAYSALYISEDGLLSMEPGVTFHKVDWREGTPNPYIDKPFIAPFHYNGLTPSDPQRYAGRIYYRLIKRSNDRDTAVLDKWDSYLANASVAMKSFRSDFALRVTWENVSAEAACSDLNNNCSSNTFQLVLVANKMETFAIFGYYKLDVPYTENQLAGVNGGMGRGWTDVIPCVGMCEKQTKVSQGRIRNMINTTGSDVVGRYILLISGDVIIRGGCLPSTLKSATGEVFPRRAGMLGGELLSVSGSCQEPGSPIYCRFASDDSLTSRGVMETTMRGRCVVPLLTTRGEVVLELSTDNRTWTHPTIITIIDPSRSQPPVNVSDILPAWYQLEPSDLVVRWNPALFSSNSQATVNITLLVYRETGSGRPDIRRLVTLRENVRNSDAVYSFKPSDHTCSAADCDSNVLGVLKVEVKEQFVDNTTIRQFINFGPLALGWYIHSAMTRKLGEDWPSQKCVAWGQQEAQQTAWLDELFPCPCTLTQALADWGRWQPDVACNMFSGSVCTYHRDSKHCVRSVQPTLDGAGNQCCYGADDLLQYAADTFQGSTPDRSHDWGASPYLTAGRVPSFSHWHHDVITFYYCCLWNNYKECDTYMERRPTKDCVAYDPPMSATAFGDPHIETFDGAHYTFGGEGDFWLLRSDTLKIQARFLPDRSQEVLQLNDSVIYPTVITSVAMESSGTDRVVIRLAPPKEHKPRRLDVLINRQRRFFEDSSTFWKDFKGVSVVNNGPNAVDTKDKSHSNFTVMFSTGVGVQVAERQGLIHVTVALPPTSRGYSIKTAGLLGTRDGNEDNDFTAPDGQSVSASAQELDVYRLFALKWAVNEIDSLFQFPRKTESVKSPLIGSPAQFPYKDPQTKPSDIDVTNVCGDNQACRRDYYITNNDTMARETRQAYGAFQALRQSQSEVTSCGLLDIPNASKSSTNYMVGTTVNVTGCRPDNTKVLSSGPLTYKCGTNGQWSPSPDASLCRQAATGKDSNVDMIVGIVAGTVIVALILITVVIVVLYRRKRSRKDIRSEEADQPVPAKRTSVPQDAKVEPGTDETLLKSGGKVRKSDVETRTARRSEPV